jgi:uncharacterized membrane protein SirB2
MYAFYPQIKNVHLWCVLLSIAIFALRGGLLLSGRRALADWTALRYLSYCVDTALLTAALMLYALLPEALFANHWLKLKLALLVIYVLLGHYTLKRAQGRVAQLGGLLAALLCFVWMYGIARAHHPMGWLLWLR